MAPRQQQPAEHEPAEPPTIAPEPHVRVLEWALAQRDAIGTETALAFAHLFGADMAPESQLTAALAAFRQRAV